MTTTPEQAPEEQPTNEETTGTAKKPTAKKKPVARKRKAATKKRKPAATKKRAASKPAEPVEKSTVDAAAELKDQFVEAAVEPTKKALATWSAFGEVAKQGLDDLRELATGLAGGFIGSNRKKDDD